MTTVHEVLLLATEGESEACTTQYITFKDALSITTNQTFTLKCMDVNTINKTAVRGSNKLKDKLKSKIEKCPLIIIVCSPDLQQYLDNGKSCSNKHLGKDERKVLMEELPSEKSKEKMILVHLNSGNDKCVPKKLAGIEVVDGVNDIKTLIEEKIPGKVKLGGKK